ncbi:MAG: anaerobic ribonucleoside-triphosphate reductase activating protein [Oscillospiraceae bacterium]|nr:anaerobic ribonucleoside-triphosphate reductase activating protein [Oscillospiraceae bacterium]
MNIRLADNLQVDSIVDGEGIRTVLWTQGCKHNCAGCHNPGAHSFDGGFSADIDDIKRELLHLEGQDGITLSGGDPFFQVEACLEVAEFCRNHSINVWCYTGFTFEELFKMSKSNSQILELLNCINVLVDGKFVERQRDWSLLFRGSKNQRVLDVKESLRQRKAVQVDKYKEKPLYKYGMEQLDVTDFGKVQYMFI